jgi:hypothetical protein
MNLDKLSGIREAPQVQNATPVGRSNPQPVVNVDDEQPVDNIDMSMIGRIMSRSIKDLANDDLQRPEKALQFKDLAERPARFTDSIIDKIFKRMAG